MPNTKNNYLSLKHLNTISDMLKNNKWILWVVAIILIYFSFAYLSDVIMYVSMGCILAFIGRPLVFFLSEKGIAGIKIPRTLASFLCLAVFGILIIALALLFIPLVSKQIAFFSTLDYTALLASLQSQTTGLIAKLHAVNLWPDSQDWSSMINQVVGLFSAKEIGGYFGSAINISSSIFITLFAMFFIAFFLLKDATLMSEVIYALTPDKHIDKMKNAIINIKELLSRYFIGLLIQMSVISLMVWAGLAMIGVDNALVLGIITGLLNLIPYIGPLLSIILGVLLGLTSALALHSDVNFGIFTLKILAVYLVTLTIDNIITQPIIFSKSVKAHPLEIFLLVMIAGTLFGIVGMIVAIPVYTIIRVIVREFFPELKIVQKMTASMKK
ncbi:MAG: AI-2E family transporter [Bacteroidia bacterium]|nr:AI-2E family transporter [Bacteroidia bacterium]